MDLTDRIKKFISKQEEESQNLMWYPPTQEHVVRGPEVEEDVKQWEKWKQQYPPEERDRRKEEYFRLPFSAREITEAEKMGEVYDRKFGGEEMEQVGERRQEQIGLGEGGARANMLPKTPKASLRQENIIMNMKKSLPDRINDFIKKGAPVLPCGQCGKPTPHFTSSSENIKGLCHECIRVKLTKPKQNVVQKAMWNTQKVCGNTKCGWKQGYDVKSPKGAMIHQAKNCPKCGGKVNTKPFSPDF